ncbi:MAG TPA: hypothetical protein PL182_11195 [Pseudobdellovibrionaceae bacterium]|nr:hypothetical protein [Pseudobdellovibrionaceae bacterium]
MGLWVVMGLLADTAAAFARPSGASVSELLVRIERLNRGNLCADESLILASSEDAGIKLHPDFEDKGARCGIFIDRKGRYGATGSTIAEAVTTDPHLKYLISNEVAENKTMKRTCPGFAGMNEDQRAHFWVWAHASIAWEESKCGAITKNGSNSEAVGLFQLEKSKSARAWRGPHCKVKSVVLQAGEPDPYRNNTLCALDIMLGQFKGMYGKPPGLYPNSYYQKLRGSYGGDFSRAILRKIRLHPGCSGETSPVVPTIRPRPRPPQDANLPSKPASEFT